MRMRRKLLYNIFCSTYHAGPVVGRSPFTVAGVFRFVKVRKQEQEHDSVQAYPDHEALRVITFDE